MWALVVLFTMVAAAGAAMVTFEAESAAALHVQDDNHARNMAVYRSLVVEHVRTHAVAAGASVPDAALSFPPWYTRNPAWDNVVMADGTIVVYAMHPTSASLVVELAEVSHGSMLAGEARVRPSGGTYLYSPRFGDTSIPLPDLHPGAPVWVALLK